MIIKRFGVITLSLLAILFFGQYALFIIPLFFYLAIKNGKQYREEQQAPEHTESPTRVCDNNQALTEDEDPVIKEQSKILPFTYCDQQKADLCEILVSCHLNLLPMNSYTVIDNAMIPSVGKTKYAQIDHIVVSRFGIFCIETKSHTGWVNGSAYKKDWAQIRLKSSYDFPNPSWQNYIHTQSLEHLLCHSLKAPIIPIVVFSSADMIIINGDTNVGDINYLINRIKQHQLPLYSQYEYEKIVTAIKLANKNDEETVLEHYAEVRNLQISIAAK